MSVPNLNPDDLELPDLPDSILESNGPVIDSSDEFPLPAWDFDDDLAGADVLFPEGIEPTTEEIPSGKPESRAVETKRTVSSVPSDEQCLDDDYFQKGLEPEKSTDASRAATFDSSNSALGTEDVLLPKVAWDKAGPQFKDRAQVPPPPPPPSMGSADLSIPSVSLDHQDGQEFIRPLRRDSWTLPEVAALSPERVQQTPSAPASGARPPSEAMLEAVFEFEPEPIEIPIQEAPDAQSSGAPVEEYVQKMAGKRVGAPPKRAVRPWVPAVGVAVLVLGYLTGPMLFERALAPYLDIPVLVVGAVPQGEVYAGDTLLGTSPMALDAETAAREDLQIRRAGYQPLEVPAYRAGEGEPDRLVTFSKPLAAKPVPITWEGLPQGAVIWWNGQKTDIGKISSAKPGSYSVKAKTSSRPAVTLNLKVAPGDDKPLAAGQLVRSAFDMQPKASISLKAPGSGGSTVTFLVESVGETSAYSAEVKVKAGSANSLYLPAPGKYRLSFDGDGRFQAVSKSFEAKAASAGKVELSLAKQPPAPVVSQGPSSPSGSGYSPPPYYQPTYSPPPAYYPSGGGGGGGGRIAPPAF